MLHQLIEQILEVFSKNEWENEVKKAKEEFFEKVGAFHEDDTNYENRVSYFLDWYVFDRNLTKIDLPPIKYFTIHKGKILQGQEKEIFEGFSKFKHSIYEVNKIKVEEIILKDLFTKEKVTIKSSPIGFKNGDIFETWLIPMNGVFYFSKGFCYHPIEVRSIIMKRIKKVRNLDKTFQLRLLMELVKTRYRYDKYQHIDVTRVYADIPGENTNSIF